MILFSVLEIVMPEIGSTVIDDIEDLVQSSETINRSKSSKLVVRGKKTNGYCKTEDKILADSIIPGTQKIYVKTWGCAHNNSDSEYMAGLLSNYGYKIIGKNIFI
ncbi:threonylcarbamoyladenosine tRNA methylthiotransferase-like [Centruroides sculpturatus]|uniref:threonylcarbamoyladenosine tRNA methylthiotransferase-like n=1 Tax=Centruroides sculpturatus TaxID=218467 RepID=UPI000C6EAC78|nr:threonylcarbamoyladenosine tRNA methylthiotransferase-like [Centruroides sculpturatus]